MSLLYLSAFASSAQDISPKYPGLIAQVKKINRDTSLDKLSLSNEEFMPQMTDGGGELTGYFKNGAIQKISREIGLSYGIETYDYYFSNGKLVFIYETLKGFVYNEKGDSVDHSKTELNFIGRYYFKNDKLIDSETTGHNRFEADDIDMEKVLLKETRRYMILLTRAKKSKAR